MKHTNLIVIKIIINIIIILILAGGLVFFINHHSFPFKDSIRSFFDTDRDYSVQKEEEYDISQIENLKFNFSSDDITFYESENNKMRVVEKARYTLKEKEMYQDTITDDTITFKQTRGIGFYLFYIGKPSSKIEVYLPKGFSNNLSIENVSGNIVIENILTVKNLELHATSGDILVKQTISSESLKSTSVSGNQDFLESLVAKESKFQSTSGDIRIYQVDSDSIFVKSTSGTLSLGTINSPGEIITTSGDIKMSELNSDAILVKSTSGTILIDSFDSSGEILSTSGDIKISNVSLRNFTRLKSVSGKLEIHLMKDFYCLIQASSVSGSIRRPDNMTPTENESPFELKLNTTSGNIRITQ